MSKEKLQQLFQKYADKTCTKEEYAQFMTIVSDQKDKAELDMLMDREWEQNPDMPVLSREKASQLFEQVMASVEHRESPAKLSKLSLFKTWIPYAAASVLLSVFALFYYLGHENNQNNSLVSQKPEKVKNVAVVENIKISTTNEHKKIKLPDGSTVVLNNNSSLEYQKDFTSLNRDVIFKGEGYFDIKHNPNKPFIVHTGNIKTTVLGTAFNINAYDTGHDVVVTVTRGKVIVQDETKTLGILIPNQQVVVNKTQMKSQVIPVLAKSAIEWQEKDLFFDEVTMEEAAHKLSTYFNVKISFANDASKDCRFTGTFLRGEGLEEILKVITSFNHIEYQKKAGEIVLSGKGCK